MRVETLTLGAVIDPMKKNLNLQKTIHELMERYQRWRKDNAAAIIVQPPDLEQTTDFKTGEVHIRLTWRAAVQGLPDVWGVWAPSVV
jgi:hypothetical protein